MEEYRAVVNSREKGMGAENTGEGGVDLQGKGMCRQWRRTQKVGRECDKGKVRE